MEQTLEHLNWHVDAQIEKWHDSAAHEAGDAPDAVEHYRSNLLLNAGIQRLLDLLIVAGGQGYNATHSRVCVGSDSGTAANATQTDLVGASKYYKLVDTVSRTSQTVTWVATYTSAIANFAWNEWGIDAGTADSATTVTAPLLNRKVVSMGTKASGSTWVLTVTITVS